jgi:hypothetical protein
MHSFAPARPSQRCAAASDAPATDADSGLASLACLHSFALGHRPRSMTRGDGVPFAHFRLRGSGFPACRPRFWK